MNLFLGAVLVAMGLVLLGAELHLSTAGALGVVGVAALVIGAALIVVGTGHGVVLAVLIAAGVAILLLAALAVMSREVRRGWRAPPHTGPDALVGRVGVVATPPDPVGQVILEGARWRARRVRTDDGGPLHAGDAVIVSAVADLTVWVRRAAEMEVSR